MPLDVLASRRKLREVAGLVLIRLWKNNSRKIEKLQVWM